MKPTLIESSRPGAGGAWVRDGEFPADAEPDLGDLPRRVTSLALPEVAEVEVVRHFTQLSSRSHGVDNGAYPLGSCTMKYNPKRHDANANLPGFRHVHPLQPESTIQGVLALLHALARHIAELTGVDEVCLQPAAGAHGELTGLLIIKKHFEKLAAKGGEKRDILLIADSAHGTNPSSASMAGFTCRIVATDASGLMDLDALARALEGGGIAGLMLTNPSTLGLFESNIARIAAMVHAKGGLLYYDGANLNALMGLVRPGDMGFDVVHINTHKTLSTPHGGGGPGAGPVGVKRFLAEHFPKPVVRLDAQGHFSLDDGMRDSIGRMKSHLGHIGVLIRAYCYILSMGPDGLREASQDAVLNANYLQHHLRGILPPAFDKHCMHECLLSGRSLPITPYSFAKRLIDLGIHPPTLVGAGCVYFPKHLHNSMLIEPTETESKASLDAIIAAFNEVNREACADSEFVNAAPHTGSTRKVPEGSKALDPRG